MQTDIPAVVVDRLPHYLRTLRLMLDEGTEVVSSRELGEALGTTPGADSQGPQLLWAALANRGAVMTCRPC